MLDKYRLQLASFSFGRLQFIFFSVPATLARRYSIDVFMPCFLTWDQRYRKKLAYDSILEYLIPTCDSKECLIYEQQLLISFILVSYSLSPGTNLHQISSRDLSLTSMLWQRAPSCISLAFGSILCASAEHTISRLGMPAFANMVQNPLPWESNATSR